jgi:hypothetical protein
MKKELLRGTVATTKKGICDVDKVLEHYSNVGNIPEKSIGFARASEMAFAMRMGLYALKLCKAKGLLVEAKEK